MVARSKVLYLALSLVVFFLATAVVAPAWAKVVVLANRTTSSVTVELLKTGQPSEPMTILAGDSRPVFFERNLKIRYGSDLIKRDYSLLKNCAYYFAKDGSGKLLFEQIGLGESELPGNSTDSLTSSEKSNLSQPSGLTIPVKLLVDDNEATHRSIWEPRLRKRLADASEVIEEHCGVKFRVVAISTWNSDDERHNFLRTFREFEREVSPQPGAIAIGFTSQYRAARGRVHMGGTRGPLYPYILLKERSPQLLETERLELLVHELGHYLGAAHSPEPHSIMRPLLTGGRMRRLGARIQFDPVNTLLMSLLGDEMRQRRVRRLTDLSLPTKNRMLEIYKVLNVALPEDPAANQIVKLVNMSGSPPLVEDTRRVLAMLLRTAKGNQSDTLPAAESRLVKGDDLTDLYVQQAAFAAEQTRPANMQKAFLLALGIFIDNENTLRSFPATSKFVSRVESKQRRLERIQSLGRPTMHGRYDLAKHFFVSAFAVVSMGGQNARHLGLAKEMVDAQGSSGFSFADMMANRAGILFAEALLAEKLSLEELAKEFQVEDFLLPIESLQEGLTAADLESLPLPNGASSIRAELERIEQEIRTLPVYSR